MFAFAKTRVNDRGGDGGMPQRPACRDIRNRDVVLSVDLIERAENSLQNGPAADRIDEAFVFRLTPVGDRGRRRFVPA